MKALVIITTLLAIFIRLPIWFYLVYVLLQAAHVDRLVWFLFWIYVPAGLFAEIIVAITKNKKWGGN